MLSEHDNYRLTCVRPDAPMGKLLRRYWIPAAKSAEVAAGGAPARVRLLGEALVAFRTAAGTVGLIEEACPHRGASLAYGRNEEGGLRCLYHGWKMAPDGSVLETPCEARQSAITRRTRTTAYPVIEAGGLIWTYMGPTELKPGFPAFPWLSLPAQNLLVVKMFQESNFLQGVEGDLDPAHPNCLHRDFELSDTVSWAGAGWKSIADLMSDAVPEIHCEQTPYLMRVGAVRDTDSTDTSYVRCTEWVAPFYCYVAAGPGESRLFKAWLPIDDHTCFTFYIHYDPHGPLDLEAIYRNWGHETEPPTYKTPHHLGNMHLQDRNTMQVNYSGIVGAAVQDRAVQESMGYIYDRRREHLGTSDRAIVFYRRLLLQKQDDMEAGRPLSAQGDSLDFDQRGCAVHMPTGRPWQEARKYQEAVEAKETSASPVE